jgi:hypothetical protein
MAHSRRAPAYYVASGACPDQGKRDTSGRARAASRDACRAAALDPEADPHTEGRNRGSAGSRDPDRGWRYFGDGRAVAARNHPMHERLCRK